MEPVYSGQLVGVDKLVDIEFVQEWRNYCVPVNSHQLI